MADEAASVASLTEERLRLEREAFEIERSRLLAARDRAEAELKVARARHPALVVASAAFLSLAAFAGGALLGFSVSEERHQRQREARLREALSQLGGIAEMEALSPTNRLTIGRGVKASPGQGVSVLVFQ